MTLMLDLSPETECLLKEKAKRAGLTLEDYVKKLAEQEVGSANGPSPSFADLPAEAWSAKWRAWANADRHLPGGIVVDDSRESIYAGRGE